MARQLNPAVPVALDTYCYPGYPAQRIYSKLDVLGISSYFGWYTGPSGHSIAELRRAQAVPAASHRRYPKLALIVSEFGAESLFDGPATRQGHLRVPEQLPAADVSSAQPAPLHERRIYWTLREFAVASRLDRRRDAAARRRPRRDAPQGSDRLRRHAKPAFAVAQQLFGTVPGFAR